MEVFVKGKCKTMCPLEEIKLRENQMLLHILEIKSGTEKLSKPRADPNKMVKAFNRSAAGKSLVNENTLRPADVLMTTLHYLLHDVINNTTVSWAVKYDFITDRLRAIRQDLIVQNMAKSYAIVILQPIVRFHSYFSYKLCDQKIGIFDPYLNRKHLYECLNRLLIIYDDLEQNSRTSMELLKDSRPEFEALHIILNLDNETALDRALNLDEIWKTPLVRLVTTLAMNYLKCNFIKVCRDIKKLPVLHAALAASHLPVIRKKTFQIMSTAYNSKQLFFPLSVLQKWLLYESKYDLINDCKIFKIEYNESTDSLRFDKNTFYKDGKIPNRKEYFVEEKLCNEDESNILLYGSIR